jgi:phosphatidylglycerophosphate synthase
MHRATPAGAILDPVMDKIFVTAVVLTLLFTHRMSFVMALLVGTRDILEVPLAAWSAFEPKLLANHRGEVKANGFGKAATLLQFATITAAIAAAHYVTFLALSSALAGAIAAATYWSRVFTTRRGSRKGFDAPRFGA